MLSWHPVHRPRGKSGSHSWGNRTWSCWAWCRRRSTRCRPRWRRRWTRRSACARRTVPWRCFRTWKHKMSKRSYISDHSTISNQWTTIHLTQSWTNFLIICPSCKNSKPPLSSQPSISFLGGVKSNMQIATLQSNELFCEPSVVIYDEILALNEYAYCHSSNHVGVWNFVWHSGFNTKAICCINCWLWGNRNQGFYEKNE